MNLTFASYLIKGIFINAEAKFLFYQCDFACMRFCMMHVHEICMCMKSKLGFWNTKFNDELSKERKGVKFGGKKELKRLSLLKILQVCFTEPQPGFSFPYHSKIRLMPMPIHYCIK